MPTPKEPNKTTIALSDPGEAGEERFVVATREQIEKLADLFVRFYGRAAREL